MIKQTFNYQLTSREDMKILSYQFQVHGKALKHPKSWCKPELGPHLPSSQADTQLRQHKCHCSKLKEIIIINLWADECELTCSNITKGIRHVLKVCCIATSKYHLYYHPNLKHRDIKQASSIEVKLAFQLSQKLSEAHKCKYIIKK
jgi:hypothetical protein